MDVRQASARSKASNHPAQPDRLHELPESRLIWTNDNLVALQTLVDERHPKTKEYRYRGKVDLIYIDPPFMVQSDFRAENSIDIDLDEDEDVEARKEPSLVEILAYKDTWRQGLDSFLAMLRARLVLLKELLAPAGSIYVHLDWHAVHYVKVMMDELFGYESLLSEIIWKRTTARSDARGFNHIHETILHYGGKNAYWNEVRGPYTSEFIKSHYKNVDPSTGRRFTLDNLRSPSPRPNLTYDYKGYKPHKNGWAVERSVMEDLDKKGLIYFPERGERLRLKRFLDDSGMPLMSVWTDIPPVNSQAAERVNYPTQKPRALLERIIRASCPPGGVVLDAFMGSGTTPEAAERLGRRWIGIDNAKYGVHLARKRLIELNGQPRTADAPITEYVECSECGGIERKEKDTARSTYFAVSPFTVENMGVYQRAESWQGFQKERTRYRDEMLRIFGAAVVQHSPLLHGTKGSSWVHVGPLDAAVSSAQVWSIAREARRTDRKIVTILSADFDTLSGSDKDDIKEQTGVTVIIRIIPASAIDEVRRRLDLQRADRDEALESMAVPAFYAPLAITINASRPSKRLVKLTLERCEIDIESFLDSQRPLLKPVTDKMTPAAKKKAKAVIEKWEARRKELDKWLRKATTWQRFIDFWAVDWDYGARVGADEKPIFETAWQSFRSRRLKHDEESLAFEAECQYPDAGHYRIAAKVTDVFGNDGLATVNVQVK